MFGTDPTISTRQPDVTEDGLVHELPSGAYNAAVDLLERNLATRADKTAFIDATGSHAFAAIAERATRIGAALLARGLTPGDRIALILQDGIDFVCCFLGAIRVGLVPIALNTLFPAEDYAYILDDSGARAAIVSSPLRTVFEAAQAAARWTGMVVISGGDDNSLEQLLANPVSPAAAHGSNADDIAFWLYSSGSTGRPKGTPHRHASLVATAELFGNQVFGFREDDIVFSAAKLFFAYGLGNALTFPLYTGATAVLFADRVTPAVAIDLMAQHGVTVFCGVPTLYAAMLAAGTLPTSPLRLCLSAGEALPEEIGRAWTRATDTEIVDGIGSTEMLHIFVSNRPGRIRYGTTGTPVPGYTVRLVDEEGRELTADGIGELLVRGPSMTSGYWNQPAKTAATFVDGWMRTGDKFERNGEGYLLHRGRVDDMLKVSGIWVSPVEVEAALIAHDAVLEAAVIGVADAAGLVKTKAFIVLQPGVAAAPSLADELRHFVKARLAPHKYPRLIAFVDALPRTATGKIRRHVLREAEAARTRDDAQ